MTLSQTLTIADQPSSHPIPVPHITAIAFPALPVMPEENGAPVAAITRLNLNESATAPSPKALQAAQDALAFAHRYPDHHGIALTTEIATRTGIAREHIVLGNGSGELLVQCALVALQAGDEAVMPSPTFPTCGKGVQMAGAQIVGFNAPPVQRPALRLSLALETAFAHFADPGIGGLWCKSEDSTILSRTDREFFIYYVDLMMVIFSSNTVRIEKDQPKEIILALSPTMEGDTTNFYLFKKLQRFECLITSISRGIAVGSELQYADELTLGRSLQQRQVFQSGH